MSERRITISLTYSEFENVKKCLELTKEEIDAAMEALRNRDMRNPIFRLEAIRQNLGVNAGDTSYICTSLTDPQTEGTTP